MTSSVRLDVADRTAHLTLNRPDAMNGIDESVLEGLPQILTQVADDESVKSLVISGAGDAFCVGLDIDLLAKAFDDLDYFRDVLNRFGKILTRIESLPVPVIASVGGMARAGGFEIILACDLVLVAEEARIADHHLSFGIPPGGGATQRAFRKLGTQKARELLLTGKWMIGPEIVESGLALTCVPRDRLSEAAKELTETFTKLSRPALSITKSLLRRGEDLPLDQGLELETAEFLRFLADEPLSREGFDAYMQDRKPSWD